MGNKTSPIGFRTGITLGWQSTWFAQKANYGDCLVEDQKIRNFVDQRFNRNAPYGAVSKVEIARTRNEVKVTLHTGRPGMVIGPRGAEVDKFREELEHFINRKVNVNVIEIKEPALDAFLVGENIGQQLTKRAAFRRAMKQSCEQAMACGAKGIKITCSGRLGGAEIARQDTQKLGSVPLQTLDANIQYASVKSKTTYGIIGIKVWIYLGKFGQEITPIKQAPQQRGAGGKRPRKAGGGKSQSSRSGSGDRSSRSASADVAKPEVAVESQE